MAPQDYLQVWGFPGTHRTQHMVIFVAKVNCNKGYKAVSKGEEWCKVQKISGASFQESSPTVVTYIHILLQEQTVTTHVKCGLPRKLFRTQGFYWVLVTQGSSSWHIPKFQTSRRKAGVPTYTPLSYGCTEPLLSLGNVGNSPK